MLKIYCPCVSCVDKKSYVFFDNHLFVPGMYFWTCPDNSFNLITHKKNFLGLTSARACSLDQYGRGGQELFIGTDKALTATMPTSGPLSMQGKLPPPYSQQDSQEHRAKQEYSGQSPPHDLNLSNQVIIGKIKASMNKLFNSYVGNIQTTPPNSDPCDVIKLEEEKFIVKLTIPVPGGADLLENYFSTLAFRDITIIRHLSGFIGFNHITFELTEKRANELCDLIDLSLHTITLAGLLNDKSGRC